MMGINQNVYYGQPSAYSAAAAAAAYPSLSSPVSNFYLPNHGDIAAAAATAAVAAGEALGGQSPIMNNAESIPPPPLPPPPALTSTVNTSGVSPHHSFEHHSPTYSQAQAFHHSNYNYWYNARASPYDWTAPPPPHPHHHHSHHQIPASGAYGSISATTRDCMMLSSGDRSVKYSPLPIITSGASHGPMGVGGGSASICSPAHMSSPTRYPLSGYSSGGSASSPSPSSQMGNSEGPFRLNMKQNKLTPEDETSGSVPPSQAGGPLMKTNIPPFRSNPNGKTRTKDKYRVVYSDHQRTELEKEFFYSRYITIRRKSELASTLGLSERQVKIWFQNRRAKERKQNKKRESQSKGFKDEMTSPTSSSIIPHPPPPPPPPIPYPLHPHLHPHGQLGANHLHH